MRSTEQYSALDLSCTHAKESNAIIYFSTIKTVYDVLVKISFISLNNFPFLKEFNKRIILSIMLEMKIVILNKVLNNHCKPVSNLEEASVQYWF